MRIRAAVLEEFGLPVAVKEIELAEPKAGEVLVRLVARGVCHTDQRIVSVGLVSHRLGLDDVNHAFELVEAQDGIRSAIDF